MRKRAAIPVLLLLLLVVVAGVGVWQVSGAVGTPAPPGSDAERPPPPPPSRPPTPVPVVDAPTEPEPPVPLEDAETSPGWTWEAPPSSPPAADLPGDDGSTLFVLDALPSTLHPLYSRTDVDRRYQDLVYDRLFRADALGVLGSDVVLRAEVLPRSVRVTLRDDVRFHSGHPLTARDVCQTVRILLDPTVPSTVGPRHRAVLAGCDANADRTATVRLRSPHGDAREALDFLLLPASLTRADLASTAVPPPGTGPMRAARPAGLLLTAYDNPHRRAAIRRISVSSPGDPMTALAGGGVQVAVGVRHGPLPDGFALAPAAAPHQALALALHEPWTDPALRDALDLALDRPALAVAAGRSGFVRPGWPAMGIAPLPPDPAAARRRLAGRTLRIASPPDQRPVAEAVGDSLRAVGLAVSIVDLPADGAVEGADARLVTWSDAVPAEPGLVLWSEDAAVALGDRVRVPQVLVLDRLFSPIEDWRLVP